MDGRERGEIERGEEVVRCDLGSDSGVHGRGREEEGVKEECFPLCHSVALP